jgi:hypothetical protein
MSARVANFVFAYRAGAGDPAVIEKAPASAFSRGDFLVGSGSGVSAAPVAAGAIVANDILAIALTDSNESINGLCPVLLPGPEDVFLSRVSGGAGSLLTTGDEIGVFADAATGGRHYAGTAASSSTDKLVVVKGQNEVLGQSDDSRILVKFLYHSGLVDLS